MAKSIRVFKSFEEQELFFLEHFAAMTPSERLQALAKLQKRNSKQSETEPKRKISLRRHFVYGH